MSKDNPFSREIHLKQEHWGNIPEAQAPWSDHNSDREAMLEKQRITAAIIPVIHGIILFDLTARQQEVVVMYFQEQHTQVEIARELGISQPTVSQHLTGKRRRGRKIGGALRRIRKKIRKRAATEARQGNAATIFVVLERLLGKAVTRRTAAGLLRDVL